MRWVFLLLLMLNAFYYIWHQQDAPLRPKEVAPLASFKGSRQDIRLLSESGSSSEAEPPRAALNQCLYLGGDVSQADARIVEQRLTSLDIQTQFGQRRDEGGAIYWLRIEPESRRLVDEPLLGSLAQDFPKLKSKIMSCEGIATID
jgi:hypothetical protein